MLPGAEFHRYKRENQTVIRSSTQYSVHDDVSQHIDFGRYSFCNLTICRINYVDTVSYTLQKSLLCIQFYTFCTVGGVLRFPQRRKEVGKAWTGPSRFGNDVHLGVTPAALRARYNLTAADVGSAANNSQAVAQV